MIVIIAMLSHQLQVKLSFIVTLALLLVALIACDQSSTLLASNHSAVSATTTQPRADVTQMAYMRWASGMSDADIMQLRQSAPDKYNALQTMTANFEQSATEVAQARIPTMIPAPPPTHSPGPSPTSVIETGMINCGGANQGAYLFNDCFRFMLSGEMLSVGAGIKQSNGVSSKGVPAYVDAHTGVVVIFGGPYLMASDSNPSEYQVPSQIGYVSIVSINNNQLVLVPVDYYGRSIAGASNIVFDLATSRFLNVTGTPIPTTPVPTLGP